ncbi:MAG: hypothetical protein ACRDP6_11265 [Actinoallomurus sp.]
MPTSVQILAIITAATMAAGVGTALARSVRVRAVAALAVACGAALLLAVTEYRAVGVLRAQAQFMLLVVTDGPTRRSRQEPGLADRRGHPPLAGFWLALAALVLTGALNAVALVRRTGGDPPGTSTSATPRRVH